MQIHEQVRQSLDYFWQNWHSHCLALIWTAVCWETVQYILVTSTDVCIKSNEEEGNFQLMSTVTGCKKEWKIHGIYGWTFCAVYGSSITSWPASWAAKIETRIWRRSTLLVLLAKKEERSIQPSASFARELHQGRNPQRNCTLVSDSPLPFSAFPSPPVSWWGEKKV